MIRRQVLMPAPPDEVWEALVDADRSEAWMGGRLTLSDLAPGAPLEFRDSDGSRRVGSVSVVRPGRYLRFTWWGTGDTDEPGASEVSYLLEAEEPGSTRLTVQEQEVVLVTPPTSERWTATDEAGFRAWSQAGALARA